MIYFLSKEFGQNVKDIWGTEEEDCKTNAQDQFGDFHFGFPVTIRLGFGEIFDRREKIKEINLRGNT